MAFDGSCQSRNGGLDEAEVGISSYVIEDRDPGLGGMIKCEMEDFEVLEVGKFRGETIDKQFYHNKASSSSSVPTTTTSFSSTHTVSSSSSLAEADTSTVNYTVVSEPERLVSLTSPTSPQENVDNESENEADHPEGEDPPLKKRRLSRNDDFYVNFILKKRGNDTLEAISRLSEISSIPVKCFGFAGIKDSFAVTQQRLSLRLRDTGYTSVERVRQLFRGRGILEEKHDESKTNNNHNEEPVWNSQAHLYDFSEAEHPLSIRDVHKGSLLYPGALLGNRFNLIIRHVPSLMEASSGGNASAGSAGDSSRSNSTSDATEQTPNLNVAERALSELRDRGFINYIGLQRFGKNGARSDRVGLHYFKRDYVKAFEELLYAAEISDEHNNSMGTSSRSSVNSTKRGSSSNFNGCSSKANSANLKYISVFKRTGCADTALKYVPERMWAEKRLLIAYSKCPPDYVSHYRLDPNTGERKALRKKMVTYADKCRYAFLSLPRNIRVLYAHAYLDRIWNLAVSERARRFGTEHVVVGDLVRTQNGVKVVENVEEASDYKIFDVVIPRLGNGHFGTKEDATSEEVEEKTERDDEDEQNQNSETEKFLGEKNIEEELPTEIEDNDEIPTLLPQNDIGSLMKMYLKYDGIFDVMEEYNDGRFGVEMRISLENTTQMGGTYSSNVYVSDCMDGVTNLTGRHGGDNSEADHDKDDVIEVHEAFPCELFWSMRGAYRNFLEQPRDMSWELHPEGGAIKTSFVLGPGQYATMLMRELLTSRKKPPPRQVIFQDSDTD